MAFCRVLTSRELHVLRRWNNLTTDPSGPSSSSSSKQTPDYLQNFCQPPPPPQCGIVKVIFRGFRVYTLFVTSVYVYFYTQTPTHTCAHTLAQVTFINPQPKSDLLYPPPVTRGVRRDTRDHVQRRSCLRLHFTHLTCLHTYIPASYHVYRGIR